MEQPNPYKENRPWGSFEQFTLNEPTTVKLIHVNPHEELSLQYHHHRDEMWRVISGNPLLTIGEHAVEAIAGSDHWIPRLTHHRIAAQDQPVLILEVAFGSFDENDNVRLSDRYGRLSPAK